MTEGATGRVDGGDRGSDSALRRELYFFTLYRVLVAGLIVFLAFSPWAQQLSTVELPLLARSVGLVYMVCAVALLITGRQPRFGLKRQVGVGLALDLLATMLAIHSIRDVESGIALLLLVNISAGALLLTPRWAIGFALAAVVLLLLEFRIAQGSAGGTGRNLAEVLMFCASYMAAAGLSVMLGRQMRESHALATQRGEEVANLAQLNELIIRRMRTGVLVVDRDGRIDLINEAAWHLLAQPSPSESTLATIAPEIWTRLHEWRADASREATPLSLGSDAPQMIPRFARLTVNDDQFIVFLDDPALLARRAEELTLSNLGRLSASIAHEVRNPLAAISYSAQLLEESTDMPDTDRRLVEIILSHCNRMNGIIENVLNLSRRERSRPETLDLSSWVYRFVDDFKTSRFLEQDDLRAVAQSRRLYAIVDPQQLHQVVNNLVENALKYGRLPDEPARITITARYLSESSPPLVEVIDRGPGIPQRVVDSVFEPFFTTHEHGTGLGLYLARQLCEANQATLEHVPLPGGGCCFRITLQRAHRAEADVDAPRTWQEAT